MKKLVSILLLALSLSTSLLVTSCDEETQRKFREEIARKEILKEIEKSLEDGVKGTSQMYNPHVYTFQYKGHDYALIVNSNGDCSVGGVLHDPECRKCHSSNIFVEEEKVDENLSEYEKIFGRSLD